MIKIITSLSNDHHVLSSSLDCIQQLGDYKVYFDELPDTVESEDIVISLLGDVIIPGELINEHTYNIHPGPPWYRGWGSRLRSVIDQKKIHGTTLHQVVSKVDAGKIIKVAYFEIDTTWTIDEIHETAENKSVELVSWLVDCYKNNNIDFEKVADWSGKFMYKAEYYKLRNQLLGELA